MRALMRPLELSEKDEMATATVRKQVNWSRRQDRSLSACNEEEMKLLAAFEVKTEVLEGSFGMGRNG